MIYYVAGTGHRPDKLNGEWNHDGPLSRLIIEHVSAYLNRPLIMGGPEAVVIS